MSEVGGGNYGETKSKGLGGGPVNYRVRYGIGRYNTLVKRGALGRVDVVYKNIYFRETPKEGERAPNPNTALLR